MGRSVFLQALDMPATCALEVILTVIWVLINQYNKTYADVGSSYEIGVKQRQFWRVLAAHFAHIDLLHIIFNLSALWNVGSVEMNPRLGTLYYMRLSALLLLSASLVELLIYHVAITIFQQQQYRNMLGVGYSAVLFGWMALIAAKRPAGQRFFSILGVAAIPTVAAPFASLVLTTLLIPRASFVAHLSGILVGFAYGAGLDEALGETGGALIIVGALACTAAAAVRGNQWPFASSQMRIIAPFLDVEGGRPIKSIFDGRGRWEPSAPVK